MIYMVYHDNFLVLYGYLNFQRIVGSIIVNNFKLENHQFQFFKPQKKKKKKSESKNFLFQKSLKNKRTD
jgi:hypothetical protein